MKWNYIFTWISLNLAFSYFWPHPATRRGALRLRSKKKDFIFTVSPYNYQIRDKGFHSNLIYLLFTFNVSSQQLKTFVGSISLNVFTADEMFTCVTRKLVIGWLAKLSHIIRRRRSDSRGWFVHHDEIDRPRLIWKIRMNDIFQY